MTKQSKKSILPPVPDGQNSFLKGTKKMEQKIEKGKKLEQAVVSADNQAVEPKPMPIDPATNPT